jgi:2-polyprenyl-3-methyl-5-hydroxy-6-metoxy-1,4-benzoquinol methylase
MSQYILRDKIQLEAKALAIGGIRLEILCVKNIEPLIAEMEKHGENQISSFPFWVKIWEAAIVLTDRLLEIAPDKDKNILEINAGMGITALFLAAAGYRVTAADSNPDALALLEKNASHNRINNLKIKHVYPDNPGTDKTWDIICGSELIGSKSMVKPVTDMLKNGLKPDAIAYLAHDISRMSMMEFLIEAEKTFDFSQKGMSFTGNGEKKKIIIHSLRHKKK